MIHDKERSGLDEGTSTLSIRKREDSNVQAETLLITTLFPNPPPALLTSTLSSPLALAASAFTPIVNTIKRGVSSHAFLSLGVYRFLVSFQPSWDAAVHKCYDMCGAPVDSSVPTILSGTISTLRQLTMRAFPELLVDIRMTKASGAASSAVADTTYTVLTYLEVLPEFQDIVEQLLGSSQSQRSWLMGQKDAPSPAHSADEEGGIMNLYVGTCDVFPLRIR